MPSEATLAGSVVLVLLVAGVEVSVLVFAPLRSRDLLAFLPGLDKDRDVPVDAAAAGVPKISGQS